MFSKSNNSLGKKLFKVNENNSVFSLTSIAYLLAIMQIAYVGETNQQLSNVFESTNELGNLGYIKNECNNDIIKMANCILINKRFTIEENCSRALQQLTNVFHRDFDNSNTIANECNQLIERRTNSMIKNIVQPNMINFETVMILINTIYFKADWDKPFKKYSTINKLFDNKYQVPMMKQQNEFPYYQDDYVQALEMPYKNKHYSMIFILPTKGIDVTKCSDYLFTQLSFNKVKIDCEIPKFTQRKRINLKPLLQQLGITNIFTPAARLDYMSKDQLYISNAIHEAVVIVDESGTEAAAVTVITTDNCARSSVREKPIQFYLHRPFLYAIKDRKNNMILFSGDYQGPN